jgi:hypothetical protein
VFGASRVLRHGEVHDKARALLSRSSFKQELPLRHRGALVNQGDVRPPRRVAGWSQLPWMCDVEALYKGVRS